MDEDDAWGDFTSADAGAKGGDAEDPFGDSFAAPAITPAASSSRTVFNHRTPFTSADFAEQAFRQQYASESSTWTGNEESKANFLQRHRPVSTNWQPGIAQHFRKSRLPSHQ
jgi:hypothetical protein